MLVMFGVLDEKVTEAETKWNDCQEELQKYIT